MWFLHINHCWLKSITHINTQHFDRTSYPMITFNRTLSDWLFIRCLLCVEKYRLECASSSSSVCWECRWKLNVAHWCLWRKYRKRSVLKEVDGKLFKVKFYTKAKKKNTKKRNINYDGPSSISMTDLSLSENMNMKCSLCVCVQAHWVFLACSWQKRKSGFPCEFWTIIVILTEGGFSHCGVNNPFTG